MDNETFIQFTLYVRIFAFITLTGLCFFSGFNLFRKCRLFWLGLLANLVTLWVVTSVSYFSGVEVSRQISAEIFTVTLIIWAILWTIDLANYSKY